VPVVSVPTSVVIVSAPIMDGAINKTKYQRRTKAKKANRRYNNLAIFEGPDRTSRLVDVIHKHGAENYAALSRVTGLPEETIRYKINVQLPRKGLTVHCGINFEKLGLTRKVLSVSFPQFIGSKATKAYEALSQELYINYFGKIMGSRNYNLILSAPKNSWTEYADFIEYLVEKEVMSNYRIEDILWSRHVPMRTDIFDFQRGEWNINWDKLGARKDAPIEPPTPLLEDELFEAPDYIDLAILSELQVNATRQMSKIASDIKVKEDTVHYHYAEHVKKRNLISNYMVSWVG